MGLGFGCKVYGSGLEIWDFLFEVESTGYGAWRSGFRVLGLELADFAAGFQRGLGCSVVQHQVQEGLLECSCD